MDSDTERVIYNTLHDMKRDYNTRFAVTFGMLALAFVILFLLTGKVT